MLFSKELFYKNTTFYGVGKPFFRFENKQKLVLILYKKVKNVFLKGN